MVIYASICQIKTVLLGGSNDRDNSSFLSQPHTHIIDVHAGNVSVFLKIWLKGHVFKNFTYRFNILGNAVIYKDA